MLCSFIRVATSSIATLVFFLPGSSAFATHKIVLKAGHVIEAQSKPVLMDNHLVFRDTSNKGQSIPLNEIDLEATEIANRGKPVAPQSAAMAANATAPSKQVRDAQPEQATQIPATVITDQRKPSNVNHLGLNRESTNEVFSRGKKVYVVAVDSNLRDLSLTSASLELERKVKEQFGKEKRFHPARTISEADFVFFLMRDPNSANTDELALVVLPTDYVEYGHSLDALRTKAIWQDAHHENSGKEAALASSTLGVSLIFHHISISKQLVKRFHASLH